MRAYTKRGEVRDYWTSYKKLIPTSDFLTGKEMGTNDLLEDIYYNVFKYRFGYENIFFYGGGG